MSERELRAKVIQSNIYGEWCVVCGNQSTESAAAIVHEPDCPLAAEPDAVKVLRLIERRAQQELDVMRNPALCDDVDRLSARASRTAYLAMAQWLRREFHVRLTETSWEWTE